VAPILAVVLAGCQGGDAPQAEPLAAQPQPSPQYVSKPDTFTPSKLGIVVRKGPPITVGFPTPEKALERFHDAGKYGAEYNDLPKRFLNTYKARTWETAQYSFGEILYDETLVAALYTEERATQDRVDEMVSAHQEQVGRKYDTFVDSKLVTYWFWAEDGQTLMICAYHTPQHGIRLTIAMGDDVVLRALQISPADAKATVAKIQTPGGRPPVRSTPGTEAQVQVPG